MSSNYRLPIKQFEKKTWQENQTYKKNLSKLKFWPFITILIVGLLIFSFYHFFLDNSKLIKNINLIATTSINSLKFNECQLDYTKEDINNLIKHIWQGDNTKDCDYKFIISDKKDKNSLLIDQISNYYLNTDNNNINIINPQKLLLPILQSDNNLYNKDSLKGSKNSFNYDFYGNCTKKNLCNLIRVKNNQITILKKDILNTTLNNYDIEKLELIEDNQDLLLQFFSNGIEKKFKFDIIANPAKLIQL